MSSDSDQGIQFFLEHFDDTADEVIAATSCLCDVVDRSESDDYRAARLDEAVELLLAYRQRIRRERACKAN